LKEGGAPWVEGETDLRSCPLRDRSPILDPLADGALLFEALREGVQQGSAKAAFDKLLKVSGASLDLCDWHTQKLLAEASIRRQV
jgi:hypothetical protein